MPPVHDAAAGTADRLRRDDLGTPSLLLDLDVFEANLHRMADLVRRSGRSLRPHVKSHKCSAIAKRQIEAGAIGVCCATLDEAEVMAEHGVTGLLITSPLTTAVKLHRLIALVERSPDTIVVIDNPVNAAAIAALAEAQGSVVRALVDVDIGFGRTGVTGVEALLALARDIAQSPALHLMGIQAYGGHLQHIGPLDERTRASAQPLAYIAQLIDALSAAGLPPQIVSGGGTGTHRIDLDAGVFTEIQAGSYVFMDAEYLAIAQPDATFAAALFVQTAVVSCNLPGQVTTDAGTKAFALNGRPPQIVRPALADAAYRCSGDEHGQVTLAPGARAPALADRLECIVPHCDPTVALYDRIHCVRGDAVVAVWNIDARGRR